jgi:hypothetical protein
MPTLHTQTGGTQHLSKLLFNTRRFAALDVL